ncbi:hypothetical protein BUY75_02500 [Staphylococcus epidermidis]|uniref:hypothetical protein n=1 Tax=Staphylococcus epidermidis TaxID=1282 RepID=UPI000D1CC004|nr:hypothetical protein [Staphylococcus epidermidis]PTE46830.1 hypothetical protein BUY75_02500 [Staphylococcus epidermidis]
MKNILLAIIALVLVAALGFGVFAYFDTKDNVKDLQGNKTETQSKDKENKTTTEESNSSEGKTPTFDEVLQMAENGESVAGIVDQEGNTWSENPGKTVSYTTPSGDKFVASTSHNFGISKEDFDPTGEPPEDEVVNDDEASEPDPEVVAQLEEDIANAGLQTEYDQKKRDLQNYLDSFE